MEDIMIDYYFDDIIYVDYLGDDERKKRIVINIHDTLNEAYSTKEVLETRLVQNASGAFLTVVVSNDEKTMASVSKFINNYTEAYLKYMKEQDNEEISD